MGTTDISRVDMHKVLSQSGRGRWNTLTPSESELLTVHAELRSHSLRALPRGRYACVLNHRDRCHLPFGTHTQALLAAPPTPRGGRLLHHTALGMVPHRSNDIDMLSPLATAIDRIQHTRLHLSPAETRRLPKLDLSRPHTHASSPRLSEPGSAPMEYRPKSLLSPREAGAGFLVSGSAHEHEPFTGRHSEHVRGYAAQNDVPYPGRMYFE